MKLQKELIYNWKLLKLLLVHQSKKEINESIFKFNHFSINI
jgi:hypothetical protein